MSTTATTAVPDLSDRSIIGSGLGARSRMALALGVICLGVGLFLGYRQDDPSHLARMWLQNWIFALAIALGGLFFVIIHHITHAGWSTAVRRPAEAIMSNLLWLWLGFVPFVLLFMQEKLSMLYPWLDMGAMAAEDKAEAALVEAKLGYLNPRFFFIRAAIYFVVWFFLAFFFWTQSVRQDSDGDVRRSKRLQVVAAPAAILFGLSITFAAFDWIMSLSPAWFSTMFGVYFFTGCCTAGFSFLALLCHRLQRQGYLKNVITPEHYHDIGKLIFAFGIVFWAYIAFSQYMLIWYANIPEETGWFLARQLGGWQWLSLTLLFGHFCIPFLFLISRWMKRGRVTLQIAAVWMLVFAWIDTYWLVMPKIPAHLSKFKTYDEAQAAFSGMSTQIFDPVNWLMMVGVLGLMISFTLARLREHPLVCRRDPRLAESLAHESP